MLMTQKRTFLFLLGFILMVPHVGVALGWQRTDVVQSDVRSSSPGIPPSSHSSYVKKEQKPLLSRVCRWLCAQKKWVVPGVAMLSYWFYRRYMKKKDDDSSHTFPDQKMRESSQQPQGKEDSLSEEDSSEPGETLSFKASKYLFGLISRRYQKSLGRDQAVCGMPRSRYPGVGQTGPCPADDELFLVSDLKKIYLGGLVRSYEVSPDPRELKWFRFVDKDGCPLIIPETLMMYSEVLLLKDLWKDSDQIDACGLQLLFLLVRHLDEGGYSGDDECEKEYIYPNLCELVTYTYTYITDSKAQQRLSDYFAYIYIVFYLDYRQSLEGLIDPGVLHLFKRSLKRVYEQMLIGLVSRAQHGWEFRLMRIPLKAPRFCQNLNKDLFCIFPDDYRDRLDHVSILMADSFVQWDEYQCGCYYLFQLYNAFHEVYEQWCRDLDEDPRVIFPNGVMGVIKMVSRFVTESEQDTIRNGGDELDLDYSFLEENVRDTRKGCLKNTSRYDNSCNSHEIEKFLRQQGQVNLEALWVPRDIPCTCCCCTTCYCCT